MALTEVKVPKSNVNDTSAKIVSWQVQDGDTVSAGDDLLTIETSKVSEEIVAPVDGIVRIKAAVGTEVSVGGVLAWVAENESEFPSRDMQGNLEVKATAKARILANELGINIGDIVNRGIITEKHVIEKAKGKSTPLEEEDTELLPLTNVQKSVAFAVTRSTQETAHAAIFGKADITKTVQTLESLVEKIGIFVPFTDLIMHIVSNILPEFPRLNARFENENICLYKKIIVGATVEVDDDLYVVNLQNTNELTLIEITEKRQEYVTSLLKGKSSAGSLSRGTFTVTVLDQPCLQYQIPIVFPEQSGILGIGSVNTGPEQLTIGLCLAYDHRVVNGSYAARFMQKVVDSLEAYVFEDA